MKLKKKHVFVGVGVLGVVITGVFGGVVAGVFGPVIAGDIFSYRYWKSVCINSRDYNSNLNKLRERLKVTPVEDNDENEDSSKKKDRSKKKDFPSEKHSFAFFRHRHFEVVPGSDVRGDYEGNPDDPIDLINYEISCNYPPFSVLMDHGSQVIGKPPSVLPAYCRAYLPTPTATPTPSTAANGTEAPESDDCSSPTPTPTPSPSPNCSSTDCRQPVPTKIPCSLRKLGLKKGLHGTDASNSNPLESVGALKVRARNDGQEEVWGSGFMIADHLFATTCHILEPLFKKDPKTKEPIVNEHGKFEIDDNFKLTVDFGLVYENYGNQSKPTNKLDQGKLSDAKKQGDVKKPDEGYTPWEYSVHYLDCSDQKGLDVAFLRVDDPFPQPFPSPSPTPTPRPAPSPVTLFYDDNLDVLKAKPAVLITYIDLGHPLDEITAEMYHCFADPDAHDCQIPPNSPTPQTKSSIGKFIMIDGIVGAQRCNKLTGVDLLLDTADTSVGASGALVLDVFKTVDSYEPRKVPLAIGLHKCCAAFFGPETGYGPPPSIPCATLERTPINQDVSTKSIIEDPKLCQYLKDVIAKRNDDTDRKITCSNAQN